MNRLDEALARLERAVMQLEQKPCETVSGDGADDALAVAELAALREKAALDQALRAEAAATVRDTLVDLRALMRPPESVESVAVEGDRADG